MSTKHIIRLIALLALVTTFVGVAVVVCTGEEPADSTPWAACNCDRQTALGGTTVMLVGKDGPEKERGTGVVIGDGVVLTAAHVVPEGTLARLASCTATVKRISDWRCSQLGAHDVAVCWGPYKDTKGWPQRWETPGTAKPAAGTPIGSTGFGALDQQAAKDCRECCFARSLLSYAGVSPCFAFGKMSHGEFVVKTVGGSLLELNSRPPHTSMAARGDSGAGIFEQSAGSSWGDRELVGIVTGREAACPSGQGSGVTCGPPLADFCQDLAAEVKRQGLLVCGLNYWGRQCSEQVKIECPV